VRRGIHARKRAIAAIEFVVAQTDDVGGV
jgi:hypothetical protein